VVAQGIVDPGLVFTHDLPLAEAARGYEVMNSRMEGSIKVALTP
jgi:threonine dehydrogenase-like Zn-dependent dehydrogenase